MSEQERLKASQIQYAQEDAIDALRAENARLREALKTYAECSDGCISITERLKGDTNHGPHPTM